MIIPKSRSVLIAAVLTTLVFTGCKTSGDNSLLKSVDSMSGFQSKANARMTTAAMEAIAAGRADEAAQYYEKLYLKDSDNSEIALNYSQALRKTGKSQRAVMVLAPFAAKDKPDPALATEFAAASAEVGNYDRAVEIADKTLANANAGDYYPRLRNIRGIVLDATGQHREAETEYRAALESWDGDATPVMNNLALSLASQGKFDEALTTLRQALVLQPKREEIAQNIEIVTNLRKSIVSAPKKLAKEPVKQ